MNDPRTIQTKRTRPKPGFRRLYAVTRSTRKRKQRAATTANPGDFGEVPGVGVPLALVVILLLHVAAIAGIWIHDKWSSSAEVASTKPALKEDVQPARIPGLDFHLVNAGDTAESISAKYGVALEALVKANEGISEYRAGWKINIPNRRLEPQVAVEAVPAKPAVPVATYLPTERPVIQTSDEETLPGSVPGPLAEVGTPEAEAGRTEEAVLIRPVTPVRRPVTPAGPAASGSRHIVKAGETFWRIAQNNGISVDALMQANPGVSANTLKIGRELVIPPKPSTTD